MSSTDAASTRSVSIRRARPDDIETLWKLVGELARYERMEDSYTGSAQSLSDCLFGDGWPRVEALVAEDQGALVGYAIFYGVYSTFWTRPMMWLEDLFVTESHRGLRVGRALMREVARVAVERRCARLDWAVLDWNQPSIEFYERLGAARHGGWHTYRLEGEGLKRVAGC